jgi:hypothetical protein
VPEISEGILTPSDLDRQFPGLFGSAVFRLETLDHYQSESFRRAQAGEPPDPTARASWDALVAEARRAGKTMSRVHVVSEPLTDYVRWELSFYQASVAAGEDVRILPRARALGLDLPDFDFWLFDDRAAAVMIYDGAGAWLESRMTTEPGFVSACRRWRDIAMSHAVPLGTYTARRAA